jgi:hypothetical protein
MTLAAALATVFWAVVAAAVPPRWYAVPRVPLVGSLLGLLPATAILATAGLSNLVTVAEPFTADVTVRLDPVTTEVAPLLLPLCVAVALLAAGLTIPWAARSPYAIGGTAALTALLTAAQYPLPLFVFVALLGPFGVVLALPSAVLTLLSLGEVVLVAAYVMLRRSGPAASVAATVLFVATGAFLWTAGQVFDWPYDVRLLLILGEVVLVAAYVMLRRTGAESSWAALVLPLALGASLWTAGQVFDWPFTTRSLITLLVLGLLTLVLPRVDLQVAAVAAVAVSATVAVPHAVDPSVSLAVHLTLAGALVITSSLLHPHQRALAWPGGLLLAAATWVRLYDVGVQAPEPYTLPTAVALVVVGLHRMHRDPELDTVPALFPGLGLAIVPSLLWALVDPLSARAAAVGLAALVLLLGGTVLRWTAPVLVGWLAGAAIVLRELAPYAAQWPQWVLIGSAGTVLFAAGITWEARLRDLRQAAAYLGRLR